MNLYHVKESSIMMHTQSVVTISALHWLLSLYWVVRWHTPTMKIFSIHLWLLSYRCLLCVWFSLTTSIFLLLLFWAY